MLRPRFAYAVTLGIVLLCSVLLSAQPTCTSTIQVIPYTLSGARLQVVSLPPITAHLNGRLASINSPKLNHRPLRIVLLLDASGSMQPSTGIHPSINKWQLALELARKLVKFAPAGSAFGILAFSGRDRRTVPLTTDRALLTTKLDELLSYRGDPHEPIHRTPLWDSLEEAKRMLEPSRAEGEIIVVSDAGENSSRTGESKLIGELRQSGVRLFSTVLSEDKPETDEERAGKGDLSLLAKEHGGFSQELNATQLLLRRSSEVDQALSTAAAMFLALIANSYTIEIENQSGAKPAKVSFKSQNRKIQLLYPRRLGLCTDQ